MQDWIKIGFVTDIPKLGARTVHAEKGDIAVFRTSDDGIFALYNRCPHKGGPLSEGIVSGRVVVCPLHSWTIDLETGEATAPDEGCTRPVESKVEGGEVWLKLDRAQLKKAVNG
jgi:nitrite reductase (NADH) small subunit